MSHQRTHPHKNVPTYQKESGVLHLFKKWPLWIAIALMMIAMLTYVLTMNETKTAAPPIPAAPATTP